MRPISGPDELDLFCRLPYLLDGELVGDLAAGRRRPGWLWLALRGGRPVARLARWSRPGAAEPHSLDIFELDDAAADRVEVGARLLRTAAGAVLPADRPWPDYLRFLPARWRDEPTARRATEDRIAALERTGARLFVERLRLEWTPPGPAVPVGGGPLGFRTVRDRAELV